MTDCPGASLATAVLRQSISGAYWDGTWMSVVPALTAKYWPVSAFPGLSPSAGGLKRGSSHDPVQVAGSSGSVGALKWVSL